MGTIGNTELARVEALVTPFLAQLLSENEIASWIHEGYTGTETDEEWLAAARQCASEFTRLDLGTWM